MAAIGWAKNASGDWNSGSNWSSGSVPGAADDVTIQTSSAQTITYRSGADTILSLDFGSTDTLALKGGTLSVLGSTSFFGTLAQTGGSFDLGPSSTLSGLIAQSAGTLAIGAGTLTVSGGADNFAGTITGATLNFSAGADVIAAGAVVSLAAVQVTGASVTLAENLTQNGSWLQSAGMVSLGSQTLALAGATILEGGTLTGTGKVALSGQTTLAGNFTEEGQVNVVNTGTITQSGYFTIGYNITDTASLTNAAGGTFQIGDNADLGGSFEATLSNGGTLIKTGAGGIAQIAASLTNTGTIIVASGDLRLAGGEDSLAGSITGGGVLELFGGTVLMAAGLTMSVGTLMLDGAVIDLTGGQSYAGVFEQNAGTLLLGGQTLALSGVAALDGGTIGGSGTLMADGMTDLGNYDVGGSTALINTGTLIQANGLYVGVLATDTAQFINAAGATWQIDDTAQVYGQAGDLITNAGTLIKATGAGTAFIGDSLTSNGTISINDGGLRCAGTTDSFAGRIGGAGLLDLDGSVESFGKNISLTIAQVLLETGTLTIGGKLAYAGAWSQTGGTLNLGGQSVTLSGSTFLDGGAAAGSGTLTVKSAELNDYVLTGSAGLTVSGTATLTGIFYDGYVPGDTTALSIAAKSVVSLAGYADIYGSAGSTLVNAGTLVKTNGSLPSAVAVSLFSTGTISAVAGTLRIEGASNSFAGAITGGGTVELDGGTDSFAAGLKVTAASLVLNGGMVTLGGSLQYGGRFQCNGATLALGGTTLSLTGAGFDGGSVTGMGSIALAGTTGFSQTLFEGSNSISNSGTIEVSNSVYVGYLSSDSVHLTNAVGSTVRLDNGSSLFGNPGSSISNAGTLIKSGVTMSAIADPFSNTGLVSVASGMLRLLGSKETLGGTMTGGGTLELYAGAIGFARGASLQTGGVLVDGATVTVGSALHYAGAWAQSGGTLSLGAMLSLSGKDGWSGGVVTGSGTLAISGTEAISGSTALEGAAVLTNTGTLVQTGGFYVGFNSSDTAVLQNQAGGVLDIVNGQIYGVAGSSIANSGTIVVNGTSMSQVNAVVTNIGSIALAQGGMTFTAGVSGSGTITAEGGTSLIFQAATSGGVVSLGTDTALSVNAMAGFTDTIQGFAAGDLIDITSLGYDSTNSLTYSASQHSLTVSNGSGTATLMLAGSYTQASFQMINDHGIIGIVHT